MKLTVLSQSFKRVKNETHATIVVALLDSNGNGVEGSRKIFKGVAKCCPEDTYDFNIGKKIALARAELKAYDCFDKIAINIRKSAKDVIKDYEELSNKVVKQYYHNVKYIKDIISKIK